MTKDEAKVTFLLGLSVKHVGTYICTVTKENSGIVSVTISRHTCYIPVLKCWGMFDHPRYNTGWEIVDD